MASTYFNLLSDVSNLDAEILYVYSDLRGFFQENYELGRERFMQKTVQTLTSNQKTIVLPAFSYIKSGSYDPRRDITRLGALNSHVQRLENSWTSVHPMFAFTGLGPAAEDLLRNIGNEAFGSDSIFARLRTARAAFVHLGRSPTEGNTISHHLEWRHFVPYRQTVTFKVEVSREGLPVQDTFSAYLRPMEAVVSGTGGTSFRRAHEDLTQAGIYRVRPGSSNLVSVWTADFGRVYEELDNKLVVNPHYFLEEG